jgi:acyl-CoA hydrolase
MKRIRLEDLGAILAGVPANPRVVVSGNIAAPRTAVNALDEVLPQYIYHALNAQSGVPDREGVTLETAFVGTGMRKSPRLCYLPARLSLVPVLFSRGLTPDVVLLHTSAVENETVSLGVEVTILPAAIEAARANGGIVIAQANPNMPYTYGDAVIPLDHIDYVLEIEEPIDALDPTPFSDEAMLIGDRIAHHIVDGSTLQLGIGGVPDAVLGGLTRNKGLRIWSEMFSDGVLQLYRKGCLADQPLASSFLIGSQDLFDWVDHNDQVRLVRTEVTNDPSLIAKQPIMTSINGALQVDLSAQANASRVRGHIYSGFGGSTDFIVGALHSPGGQAYIALPSWHPKANASTIVPSIVGPVTSFQHSAIVTEQGVAWLFGRTEDEQTTQIIEECAHPNAREGLRNSAVAIARGASW